MDTIVLPTPLGDLAIDEVYMEYDGPRVFSCRDGSGSLFLGIWAEESTTYDRWLLIPISERRLEATATGALSLRDAIDQAENGWAWLVTTIDDNDDGSCFEKVNAGDVPQKYLPAPDLRLSRRNLTLLVTPADPVAEAVQGRRHVAYVFLDPPGLRPAEIQSSLLGHALISFQNVVTILAARERPTRGRLPLNLERATAMLCTGQVAGSFGVRLEAQDVGNLFGESMVSEGLDATVQLLNSSTDTDMLRARLLAVGPRAAAQYHQLLKTAFDGESGLRMEWGAPTRNSGSAKLSKEQVRTALEFLAQVEPELTSTLRLVGRLVGINVVRRTFEFVTDDDATYTGTYGPDLEQKWQLTEAAVTAVLEGLSGSAILEETVQVTTATGRESFSYVLLAFSATGHPDSSSPSTP